MLNMNLQEYITQRVDDQIKFLSNRSRLNKLWFTLLVTSQILLAAMLPVITNAKLEFPLGITQNILVSSIGVLIVISTGLLNLNKYQEKWLNYRKTCEKLKQEKYVFLTRSTEYQIDNISDFVSRIEGILGSENEEWANGVVRQNEAKVS